MKKNFGKVFTMECEKCETTGHFELHRLSIWDRIFFIPLILYKEFYYLVCPNCGHSIEQDKQKFYELKAVADAYRKHEKGLLTDTELNNTIYDIKENKNFKNFYLWYWIRKRLLLWVCVVLAILVLIYDFIRNGVIHPTKPPFFDVKGFNKWIKDLFDNVK